MLSKINYDTILEVGNKITNLTRKAQASKNLSFINDEIKKYEKKQPNLIEWFAAYSQACLDKGLDEVSMAAMTAVFLVTVGSFLLQDEIDDLERLFGKS